MRTTTKECGHCGIEYYYYLSGNNTPEYNSDKYCTGCEKVRREAVEEAFKSVPVLFKYEFILTDDFTLKDLLEIEKVKKEEEEYAWQKRVDAGEVLFPLARRVWASLYDWDKKEHRQYNQVKYNGELYSYCYWPSKPEEAEIKIWKRIDMTTGSPVHVFRQNRND